MSAAEQHIIEGEEKNTYLRQLDFYLDTLIKDLTIEKDVVNTPIIRDFGESHNWDWTRLPKNPGTYKAIAQLLQRIRKEYSWFDWKTFSEDSSKNFGYFEQLNISSELGLPWVFDFVELHRLKKEASKLLGKARSYADIAKDLETILLGDNVEFSEVTERTQKIHKEAMKISFLEKLKDSELLGWESTEHSLQPITTKVIPLGGEELWNIKFISYSPSKSLFSVYVIDLWQDNREPQITESDGLGSVSQELAASLKFSEDNSVWYVLKKIDETFKSLHPVHASRAVIGPFENKYLTKPTSLKVLQTTKEILEENQNFSLLRLSVQYAFAPNHESKEEIRQIIYREDWCDEFIVCPARYSSKVSSSVLGTRVRILEAL